MIDCLSDITVVSILEEDIFNSLTREMPNRSDFEKELIEEDPKLTSEEIDTAFMIKSLGFLRNRDAYRELSKYGNTRDEIIAGLNFHLLKCKRCREGYFIYLDETAENGVSVAKTIPLLEKSRYVDFVKANDVLGFLDEWKTIQKRRARTKSSQ